MTPLIFRKNIYLSFLAAAISCSPSSEKEDTKALQLLPLSYAQGFQIFQGEGFKVVQVTQAFPEEHDPFRYLILEEEAESEYDPAEYDAIISRPVESLVLTSTTQVPHLDLLGITDRMVGFPNTDLISSESMRKQIDQGKVIDLGKGPLANMEMMIDLDPDLVIISTLGDNLEQLPLLKNAGIPVILNGEYTEQNPLGRAEWIKLTGAMTGKYKESLAVFEEIEADYLSLKAQIAQVTAEKPTVISGMMYKDIWYAPAADNWGAIFLKDAGADYIFKNQSGTGSLQLNYEYVVEKALDADIWIGAADFKDLAAMKEADNRYTHFKAFQQGQVYTFTNKRGDTGGIEYFELGYMRPDLVLKDLIKIFHPDQLPEYESYFYEKLN